MEEIIEKDKDCESTGAGFCIGIVISLVLVAVVGSLFHSSYLPKQEKRNYDRSVKICGADNVKEIQFTSGPDKWVCADYSLTK